MAGYTKLFSTIVSSTIWREPAHVRLVWITMLALSDQYGIVEASIPGLADMARVSREDCEHALGVLSSPDPDSRTKEFEGRRIEVTDGGWRLVNHRKYREKMRESDRKAKRAAYMRDYRDRNQSRNQNVTPGDTDVTPRDTIRRDTDQIRPDLPSEPSSQDLKPDRVETPLTRARPSEGGKDFMNCGEELPCPLNLYDKAKERGVLSELAKAFGREPEWVESVAYEFVSHWTVGDGMGQRRKAWMGKLRKWVTDKHAKNEGPALGAIAHQRLGGRIDDPTPKPQLSQKDRADIERRVSSLKKQGVIA
jgi:hypothetical protein